MQYWQNHDSEFPAKKLLLDSGTLNFFSKLWGDPDPESIQVTNKNQLLDLAWSEAQLWAILPFEDIQPRWKVIAVDGYSPIRKDFNPEEYPLKIPFGFIGSDPIISSLHAQYGLDSPEQLAKKQSRERKAYNSCNYRRYRFGPRHSRMDGKPRTDLSLRRIFGISS